jgi:hypothetical protein
MYSVLENYNKQEIKDRVEITLHLIIGVFIQAEMWLVCSLFRMHGYSNSHSE